MEFNCGFSPRKHPIFSPVDSTKLYCGESTKQNNCSKLNKQVSKNVSQTNHLLKVHHPFGLNVFCASTMHSRLKQKVSVISSQGFWQQSHSGVSLTLCAWPAENSGELSPLERDHRKGTDQNWDPNWFAAVPTNSLGCSLLLCLLHRDEPLAGADPSNPGALHPTLHPKDKCT